MGQFFSAEGPIFRFMTVIGNMILATILWMIGCLPVITVGTSTAALYYTTVKSVRKEVGYVHTEFWRGYKNNLRYGTLSTVAFLLLAGLLWIELRIISQGGAEASPLWRLAVRLLAALVLLVGLYLFPVMSRFQLKLGKLCILSFLMSVRFWYITLALAAGLVITVLAQIYLLPLPLVLLTPGLWCYLSSFLVERAMKAYMPKPQETVGPDGEPIKNWYD